MVNRGIEQSLHALADRGWGSRRIIPREDFVLRAAGLPRAQSPEEMAEVVQRLYGHARKWAPGFEVPFYVPKIIVSPYLGSAGQYRVDPDGYLFTQVAPEFAGTRAALLAVLAHEACHHILDLSGLRGGLTHDLERLTDLATFICGFGELVLNGHSHVMKVGSSWTSVHLGYLSSEEYRLAQSWVLKVQNLPEFASVREPDTSAATIATWFRKRLGARKLVRTKPKPRLRALGGSEARQEEYDPSLWSDLSELFQLFKSDKKNEWKRSARCPKTEEPTSPTFDPVSQRRKVALACCHGDQALLSRLLHHERLKQPLADEVDLLDSVIESLERDRR